MNYTTLNEKITNALVENGYIVIENALDIALVDKLLKEVSDEALFERATISRDTVLDNNRRRDKISWLHDENSSHGEFLSFISSLQKYLNYALYLGLHYYEAHFAIYNQGDFYEKHLDSFKNSKNRVVTTVFYLNECQGGELVIYDEEDRILQKVKPKKNTLVVFLSEKFPHEVLPAESKRYSIAGWYRVDKIDFLHNLNIPQKTKKY